MAILDSFQSLGVRCGAHCRSIVTCKDACSLRSLARSCERDRPRRRDHSQARARPVTALAEAFARQADRTRRQARGGGGRARRAMHNCTGVQWKQLPTCARFTTPPLFRRASDGRLVKPRSRPGLESSRLSTARPETPPRLCGSMISALGVGLVIGLAVEMVGGGGAVLAVPALVYAVGLGVHEATTVSLAVVSLGATTGAVGQARRGAVCWASAGWFALAAALGSIIGTLANRALGD